MQSHLDHEKLDVYQLGFFDDARGSATECAACLDALVAKKVCNVQRVEPGKSLLVRIVSMLTKLVERFSPSDQVREEQAPYGVEDEDENEDENDGGPAIRQRS